MDIELSHLGPASQERIEDIIRCASGLSTSDPSLLNEALHAFAHSLESKASRGDRNAITALAELCGSSMKLFDEEERERILTRAAHLGHVRSQSCLGDLLLERVSRQPSDDSKFDFSHARRWYENAARNGDVSCQGYLGILLSNGRYCDPELEEAAYWLRMASAGGDPDAGYRLVTLIENGQVVPTSDREANVLLERSATLGCEEAMFRWAQYLETRGDSESAIEWYRRAKQYGGEAGLSLGRLLLKTSSDDSEATTEALRALEVAAKEGLSEAALLLGEYFAKTAPRWSDSRGRDWDWYERACELGSAEACEELAERYFRGRWLEPGAPDDYGYASDEMWRWSIHKADFEAAEHYFSKAARLGSKSAEARLAASRIMEAFNA